MGRTWLTIAIKCALKARSPDSLVPLGVSSVMVAHVSCTLRSWTIFLRWLAVVACACSKIGGSAVGSTSVRYDSVARRCFAGAMVVSGVVGGRLELMDAKQ
jgi:hypothetical protein